MRGRQREMNGHASREQQRDLQWGRGERDVHGRCTSRRRESRESRRVCFIPRSRIKENRAGYRRGVVKRSGLSLPFATRICYHCVTSSALRSPGGWIRGGSSLGVGGRKSKKTGGRRVRVAVRNGGQGVI